MRRPGVRFWRRVLLASVILFDAGVVAATISISFGGAVHVGSTTSVLFGGGAVGVGTSPLRMTRDSLAKQWTRTVMDPERPFLDPEFLLRPAHITFSGIHYFLIPAYYLAILPALTGIAAGIAIRHHRTNTTVVECPNCGYALAGLPAGATACPECGSKIGAAAAKAP